MLGIRALPLYNASTVTELLSFSQTFFFFFPSFKRGQIHIFLENSFSPMGVCLQTPSLAREAGGHRGPSSSQRGNIEQSRKGYGNNILLDSDALSSSDTPFTGYDPQVWSRKKNGRAGLSRSTSIRILKQISERRNSDKDTRVSQIDELRSPLSGNAAPCARAKRVSASKRLSVSLNDTYSRLNSVSPRLKGEDNMTYLKRLFTLLDVEKRGRVSRDELATRLRGGSSNDEYIDVMMSAADRSCTGYVNEDAFVSFFLYVKNGDACLHADQNSVDESTLASKNETLHTPKGSCFPVLPVRHQYYSDASPHAPTFSMHGVTIKHLRSQSDRIKSVAASPDGQLYAVAHRYDSVVHIYTVDGVEVRRLIGHRDALIGITFSPNRKFVATASRDSSVICWDRTVGLECNFFEHPGVVTAVAFSFDGKFLYTGCQDNLVRRFNTTKGKVRSMLRSTDTSTPGVIISLATQRTRNEFIVFSRSCDSFALICDAKSFGNVTHLKGHDSIVWHSRFSADDITFLTCCERKIIVWDGIFFTKRVIFDSMTIASPYSSEDSVLWTAAVFGPIESSQLIFCFNSAKQVHILDINHADEGSFMDLHLRGCVFSVSSFVADSLMFGDDDGNVYRLEIT